MIEITLEDDEIRLGEVLEQIGSLGVEIPLPIGQYWSIIFDARLTKVYPVHQNGWARRFCQLAYFQDDGITTDPRTSIYPPFHTASTSYPLI